MVQVPRRHRRPRLSVDPGAEVWEASGHVATFTDPLVDCRNCKERFRADHLPESYERSTVMSQAGGLDDINAPTAAPRTASPRLATST